jgi:hypothetical protein
MIKLEQVIERIKKIRKEKWITYNESNFCKNEKDYQEKIKTNWRKKWMETYWQDF